MRRAYLSLGSNLGDRRRYLAEAVRLLARPGLIVRRVSSVWETEPQEVENQPWFLNAVAEIETDLDPLALLAHVRLIEARLGRVRYAGKGPRTLDIDILLYGNEVLVSPELTLPHPRLALRRFVLEPLAELDPELAHPILGRTVRELLAGLTGQQVRRIGPLL